MVKHIVMFKLTEKTSENMELATDSLRSLENKIETLINWPKPIYKNKGLKIKTGKLPKTEKIVKEIISLPIYPEMSNKQVHYVINTIVDFFKKN